MFSVNGIIDHNGFKMCMRV